MKRPLVLFSIAMIFGIISAKISDSYLLGTLLVICIGILAISFSIKYPKLLLAFIGMALFYSVGTYLYLYSSDTTLNRLEEFAGKEVVVRGLVSSEPDIRSSKILYMVDVEEIYADGRTAQTQGKILLTTLRSPGCRTLSYGNWVQIKGELSLPKGKRNPGGFDYRTYLASIGVSATLFAKQDAISVEEQVGGSGIKKAGLNVRNRVIGIVEKNLPAQQAGLLNGMLIGYRGGLDENVQEAFSNAGLTHIMAVSGANVAFIVIPLLFLLGKLRLGRKTSNLLVIGVLVFFVFVTGFSASVVRAVIMAIIILVGKMMRKEADVYTSIAFAAILLLGYNPFTLFDIGFQLSFAATLSLVLFYKNIKGKLDFKGIPEIIKDALAATLSAQIGVLPITMFYFNKVSVIAILANLLVVPFIQVITILGFAMVILGQIHLAFAQVIGYLNSAFLSFILLVTKVSAELPFSVVEVTTPSVFMVIVYYVLILFFFWYKPLKKIKIDFKYYAIGIVIVLAAVWIQWMVPKELEVVFIDVGQGDAAFIQTEAGKAILIDGGGYNKHVNTGSNIGDTVIIPFLLDYGVSKLDMVVATHGHDDHIQGLVPVLEDFKVDTLVLPVRQDQKEFKDLLKIAERKKIKVGICEKGDRIRADEATYFDVLHPIKGPPIQHSPLNNGSLVLKLNYGDTRILFTGDIEEEAEGQLLESNQDLQADVLKVAHHGSKGSSKEEFLDAVNPAVAVISVGKNNFGHPSDDVLERFGQKEVCVFRTDQHGAVMLRSDGNRIKVDPMIDAVSLVNIR